MSTESTISYHIFILSFAGRCLQQWDGHVHLPVRGSLLVIQGLYNDASMRTPFIVNIETFALLVIQGLHNDHYDAYGYRTSMMETFIVNIKPFFPFSSM